MNNFIIPLFILLFSTSISSQSKEDYSKTLDLISKAFNEKEVSLIHQKFNSNLKSDLKEGALKKNLDSLYKDKGRMSSYELIIEDEESKSYLVEFENSSMLILINLSSDNQITLFKVKDY